MAEYLWCKFYLIKLSEFYFCVMKHAYVIANSARGVLQLV
jgi:hypothetical protein